jgi:hypothetical protein
MQIISYTGYRKLLAIMRQVVIPLPAGFEQTSGAGAVGHVEGAES